MSARCQGNTGREGSPLLLNLGALIAFHTICGHNVMQRKRKKKLRWERAGRREGGVGPR